MERAHLNQAGLWLKAANFIFNDSLESRDKYAVSVALAVHAIIKGNDALTFKFLNTTARRHDDARRLFEDLVRRNFIKSEYSRYKETIQEAINNKAKSEYRLAFFSKNDAEIMIKRAERFLSVVETILT